MQFGIRFASSEENLSFFSKRDFVKQISLILLGLGIASSAFAHDHWGQKELVCGKISKEEMTKKMSAHESKFLKKFNLTADQQTKVRDARTRHTDKIFGLMQGVKRAHTDLMTSIEKDADRDELRQKFNGLQAKKQSLMAEKLEGMLDIRDILTPEQRQEAIGVIKEKKDDLCD